MRALDYLRCWLRFPRRRAAARAWREAERGQALEHDHAVRRLLEQARDKQ